MSGLLEINKIQLLMILIIPGFISVKIWSLIVATKKTSIKNTFFEVICYSFINFSLLFWLITIAEGSDFIWQIIIYISILFVFPIIWPILWKMLLESEFLKGKILDPSPTSWDYYFSLARPCFMLIHLKNNKLIGGLYYDDSFASSYPVEKDLYISEVWEIDGNGKFLEKIEQTDGLLISYEAIDYIELFKIN